MDTTPIPSAITNPAEKRAAALRGHLQRGGSVRVTAFGSVERRDGTGRVCGRYADDVVRLGLAEGWLEETRRRATPLGEVVEYGLRATEAAEAKPETVKRPRKPVRVKRTVRQRKPAPTPTPCPFAIEVVSTEAAAAALRALRPAPKPKPARKPKPPRKPKAPRLPTRPAPLADGTPCITVAEAVERWGCTRQAVSLARWKGVVDGGGLYRPDGWRGGNPTAIALTDKTLAYADRVWVRGSYGGRATGPRASGGRPVEFVRGEEVLQGDLHSRLGYAGNPRPSQIARLGAIPSRLVNPDNHRCGRLYTAGPELVAVASALGITVTLTALAEPPAQPEHPRPEPEAGPADWRELLADVSTETPAL